MQNNHSTLTTEGMGPPTSTSLSESLVGRKRVKSSGMPAGSKSRSAGRKRSQVGTQRMLGRRASLGGGQYRPPKGGVRYATHSWAGERCAESAQAQLNPLRPCHAVPGSLLISCTAAARSVSLRALKLAQFCSGDAGRQAGGGVKRREEAGGCPTTSNSSLQLVPERPAGRKAAGRSP